MITALSPALPTREVIYRKLKADIAISDIGLTIYPGKLPNKPQWPFIIVATPSGTPVWQDGGDGGSEMSGIVHAFIRKSDTILDAEVMTATVNAHVTRILAGVEGLVDGLDLSIVPTRIQIIRDDEEADAWHGMVSYDASAT